MSSKRILITNDDGINAPGIKALEQSLAPVGEVTVIAPEREMSATSQSISLHTPLRIHRIDDRHYAIGGTPADSVILALYKILPQRPDLVVSGINPGGNMGENVVYSGTVGGANGSGGARCAVLRHIPRVAEGPGFFLRRGFRGATCHQDFGRGSGAGSVLERECAAR